jgi:maltokinase
VLERLARALATVLATGLPAHLPRQRWFGGKGRALGTVQLLDLVALDPAAGTVSALDETPLLAIVRVSYADGTADDYTLPLRLAAASGEETPFGVIQDHEPRQSVFDASTDGAVIRALLAGFATSAALTTWRGVTLRYGDVAPTEQASIAAQVALTPRALGAEQSNTSLRVGEQAIFKLFRRLEDGENPEIEVGRFLGSRTGFRAMPRLLGSLSYDAGGGATRSVGVLQSFVASRGDGWRWMLDRLRARRDGTIGDDVLVHEARLLGDVTAEMHLALGSDRLVPGFAPRKAVAADAHTWSASFVARARRVIAALGAAMAELPPRVIEDARWLIEAEAHLLEVATRADVAGPGFDLIRVHGDYHLGQTLRVEDGFVVMDFEGEPVRPLAERRAPNCALKDVAGMLRSFDYAGATVAADTVATPTGAAPATERAKTPSTADMLREIFLAAYVTRAEGGIASFLPSEHGSVTRWTEFFELDKALYEIEYELRNRPDWLWIPLRGVRRRLETKPA